MSGHFIFFPSFARTPVGTSVYGTATLKLGFLRAPGLGTIGGAWSFGSLYIASFPFSFALTCASTPPYLGCVCVCVRAQPLE